MSEIIFSETKKDGTIHTIFADGSELVEAPDGTRLLAKPDGSRFVEYPNGDSQLVWPDRMIQRRYADGRLETRFPDGGWDRKYPDGRFVMAEAGYRKLRYACGTVICESTGVREEYSPLTGTFRIANDTIEHIDTDGTTKIYRISDVVCDRDFKDLLN